jgi:uncharacterized membrane protein YqjE
MPEPNYSRGEELFHSLSLLAGTAVAIFCNSLDLLSSNLEKDRAHLISLLILTMVSLVCLGITVVLVSILVVLTLWDSQHMLSVGVISGFWRALGALALVLAWQKARAKPRLFEASLAELSKGRQQLDARL